jgi:hypothetical protein
VSAIEAVGDAAADQVGLARSAARVATLVLAGLGFLRITVWMTGYWLWEARGAVADRHGDRDLPLVASASMAAFVPLLAGGMVTWVMRRRECGSGVLQVAAGLATSTVLAVPGLMVASAATVVA